MSDSNKKEMGGNFQCIPHSFIADFLDSVLENEKQILDKPEYRILKSAIIQVIEN